MFAMLKENYKNLVFFHDLSPAQLALLETVMEQQHFSQGQIIFNQGQPAVNLFLLANGEVVIHYKPYDGPNLTVAHIQPGGVFGWSSALGRDCYTSTALASEDSDALRINGYNLKQFCASNPAVGQILLERLASVIAERLQSTYAEILSILMRGMENSTECGRKQNHDG